jgi:alcohol dehydrogenase (cytochrome c)
MLRISISALAVCFASFVADSLAQTIEPGKAQFQARCASCHGEDGTGGARGINIVDLRQPRATSKDAVRDLIRTGIPNGGMPGFSIADEELQSIAAYVMSLRSSAAKARATSDAAPGDAAAGERLFAERAITVRLRDGRTIRGLARNESAFDLQLLGVDGTPYLLAKDQIVGVVGEKSPVKTTPTETRDLTAYLSRLATGPNATTGIPFADVVRPKPGTWPTYDGSQAGNRFSSLDQINISNVQRLAPKWMFNVRGAPRDLEVTPLVAGGVMYVTSVNEAFALDARSGRQIWHYGRPRTQGLVGDAASGINRGVALLGDRVFMVTDNAHLIALHRATGQLLWDVEMADARQNYGATGAPLVVNDVVIAGVSGGDEGIRGFVDAYRAATGAHVWRFWTVPAPGEPGSETWRGRAIDHGCAATWLTGSYDPDARLLYWPTGNPCPDYNGAERQGDNLYSSSVVALDPDTGRLTWHYQFTPHDLHDWDATETPVLIDVVFHGAPRKLMLQGNRNGFFYVLDRLTGKVLLAEPFVKNVTWASGIGPDGRPILLPGNDPTADGQRVCPAVAGAANWTSTAFSPLTQLFYMFAEESCSVYSKNDQWWEMGKSFYGGGTRGDSTSGKFLKALDIQTGKTAWEIPDVGGGILGSGLMATAGGLLFYGDGAGAFIAADAKNGTLLWHFNTGQRWKAGPMTYTVDGNQYIGVAAGSTIVAFGLW